MLITRLDDTDTSPLSIYLLVFDNLLTIFLFSIQSDAMYFSPRALPSAGAISFVQSMFCNYQMNQAENHAYNLPKFTQSL